MAVCDIDVSKIFGSLQNPQNETNFLTPGWEEPTDMMPSAWSIKIFVGDTPYQFTWYYKPESMRIENNCGEPGKASFIILDDNELKKDIPFTPVAEQLIEIWNIDETYLYFKGYISRDPRARFVFRRDDFSEVQDLEIECTDLFHVLDRRNVYESYTDRKLGFILRDVIKKYAKPLDFSAIDGNAGIQADKFTINGQKPSQVLQRILELMDWTAWIDPVTMQLRVGNKTTGSNVIPFTITDENIYDTFEDDFEIRRENAHVRNVVDLHFTHRYSKGTCNVQNKSQIVVGFADTEWETLPVPTDSMRFRLESQITVYDVIRNNSTQGGVQEIIIGSDYEESLATDQPYRIFGHRRRIRESNTKSVKLMSQLRGDDGIFAYTVSEDNNTYTTEEARIIAKSMLSLAQPLPRGQATTYNDVFQILPLRAGQTIKMDLPQSKRYVGEVTVEQIVLTDEGGWTPPRKEDGSQHPELKIRMDFTPGMLKEHSQLRKLMQDTKKIRISDEDQIEAIESLDDLVAMKDCISITDPFALGDTLNIIDDIKISQPQEIGDTMGFDDEISIREVNDQIGYFTDEAVTLGQGPDDYAFTS